MNNFADEVLIIISVIFLALYFLPTIVAWRREKSNLTSIFLLNLLLGWSFFGWIASLVWACSNDQTVIVNNSYSNHDSRMRSRSGYDSKLESLERLKKLFDAGVLTQEEFDEQKAKILAE